MLTGLAILALATCCLGVLFLGFYFADLMTRSKRHRVQGTPADLGLRYEEVQFLTADRLTLDYGAAFYSHDRMGHRLTVRWR